MSEIDGKFVRSVAQLWHRFDPQGQDMELLAEMLRPMDDAGEAVAERLTFDMEPADFLTALDAQSAKESKP
jgi:hypothetical protein